MNRRFTVGLKLVKVGMLLVSTAVLFSIQSASAQPRFMQLKGEITSPAFEGWWPNDDGSFKLFFGYMNSNWEEHHNVPIGPDNYFAFTDAGGLDNLELDGYDFSQADKGQPTHFYPRRNPFLFTIDVPSDFADRELVCTLKTKGNLNRAYGSLKGDYLIEPHVISNEV